MALRTSTQVMSAILSVFGSGAVSGWLAMVSASAPDASATSASFKTGRRRGAVAARSASDMRLSSRHKAGGVPLWAAMLSRALIPDFRLLLPSCRGAELRAPFRRHGGARHFFSAQIDLVDSAG